MGFKSLIHQAEARAGRHRQEKVVAGGQEQVGIPRQAGRHAKPDSKGRDRQVEVEAAGGEAFRHGQREAGKSRVRQAQSGW